MHFHVVFLQLGSNLYAFLRVQAHSRSRIYAFLRVPAHLGSRMYAFLRVPAHLKNEASSWLLLAAPGCSWLLLAAPGCSWQLLGVSLAYKIRILAASSQRFFDVRPFCWYSKFACSLRGCSVFCFSGVSLALKIRILAVSSYCFWTLEPFAGTQNSHSRCKFPVFFDIRPFCWQSKIAFSLWCCSVFCFSGVSLAFKIRIIAASSHRF